jgi:hypothetical protein
MFIPEYAVYLLNRLEVGHDGKTAYERSKGKKPTVLGIEFGEKVLFKLKPAQKMEKINPRWEYGIFVGVRRRSGEIWVSTKEKVFAVRSVTRIPIESRWSRDNVDWVTRVPWNRYKDAEDADGELPEAVEPREVQRDVGDRVVFVETQIQGAQGILHQKGGSG